MDFKSVLIESNTTSQFDVLSIENEGYTTMQNVIENYESLVNSRRCNSEELLNMPGVAEAKVTSIHNELKEYWSQFGILDKSNTASFLKLIDDNAKFYLIKDEVLAPNKILSKSKDIQGEQ